MLNVWVLNGIWGDVDSVQSDVIAVSSSLDYIKTALASIIQDKADAYLCAKEDAELEEDVAADGLSYAISDIGSQYYGFARFEIKEKPLLLDGNAKDGIYREMETGYLEENALGMLETLREDGVITSLHYVRAREKRDFLDTVVGFYYENVDSNIAFNDTMRCAVIQAINSIRVED